MTASSAECSSPPVKERPTNLNTNSNTLSHSELHLHPACQFQAELVIENHAEQKAQVLLDPSAATVASADTVDAPS